MYDKPEGNKISELSMSKSITYFSDDCVCGGGLTLLHMSHLFTLVVITHVSQS